MPWDVPYTFQMGEYTVKAQLYDELDKPGNSAEKTVNVSTPVTTKDYNINEILITGDAVSPDINNFKGLDKLKAAFFEANVNVIFKTYANQTPKSASEIQDYETLVLWVGGIVSEFNENNMAIYGLMIFPHL